MDHQHMHPGLICTEVAALGDADATNTDNGTPPLGRQQPRLGPFGAGRDSPETQLKKKEEFIGLCARAWDLFHS
jgi:hypothetical protein